LHSTKPGVGNTLKQPAGAARVRDKSRNIMSKQDPPDPRPVRAAAADPIRPATAHAPEPEASHDGDARLVDDRSTAQVIATGEGEFGVIWNGELRPERYPTKGIAYFAIIALRRHEAPPIAPD
jgi:hypothetical protein